MQKTDIHIIWFRRDLRIEDHRGFYNALNSDVKILPLYIQEESLIQSPEYSTRHWTFIKQSLIDMDNSLAPLNTQVMACRGEALMIFKKLMRHFNIKSVYCYEELGIDLVHRRDQIVKRYFKNNGVNYHVYPRNGLRNWPKHMNSSILQYELHADAFISKSKIDALYLQFPPMNLYHEVSGEFQKGGRQAAEDTLYNYDGGESRLSPYISWGNLSVKEVYQFAKKNKHEDIIQQLNKQNEIMNDYRMQEEYELPKLNESVSSKFNLAWQEGKTGFPLLDASIKCLEKTGFLPYKLRVYIVNFYTHYLFQPWQDAAVYLSKRFLDFHPAIHYPQLRNTKAHVLEAEVLDPDGSFIRKWIPELGNLPLKYVHKPYTMSLLDQQNYGVKIGKDYPKPINALHYDL